MFFNRVALKRGAFLSLPLLAATATAAPTDQDVPGAVPYDAAFRMVELRNHDELHISADGSRIAYVAVTPPTESSTQGRFLPNGVPTGALGARIYVAEVNGAKAASGKTICGGNHNQWGPSWAPDAQTLSFYSDAGGLAQLWVYSLKGGECRKLNDAMVRANVFTGYTPQWSPDGRTVYVPLHPNPAVKAGTSAAASVPTEKPGQGSANPYRHFSGSEDEQAGKKPGTKSGNSGAIMMEFYNSTLAAIDVGSGESRVIADAKSEPRPNILEVSPSGKWLSFRSVMYKEQEISVDHVMDLAVVPAAGGQPKLLVKGMQSSEHNFNYTRLNYRWHPTEDRLIYLKDNALWVVDVTAEGPQAPRQLAADLGELAPVVAYFTKDGRSVLVGTQPDGVGRSRSPRGLALVSLQSGAATQFALPNSEQWQFINIVLANENVLWQPDNRFVAVQVRSKANGEQAVMKIDTATGKATTLAQGLYQLNELSSGGDHRQLVGIYEDVGTPPDVFRFSADLSNKQRLSTLNPAMEGVNTGTAKVFDARAPLYDGKLATVRTTLLLPKGAKPTDKLPAIVMIYSGSDLSTRATYFGGGMGNTVPNILFTSRGIAVIMADVRLAPEGESSFPAQQMVDVLLPQIYAAANAGYIDVNRLAVSGQSYGGYSTASIVSYTNLFRAGIPVNGVFDLASFYGSMGDDDGDSHWIRWAEKGQGRMGHSPWQNPQRFIDNSPFYRIERINTPLLIVAGQEDTTVPYQESKKLFVGLRRMERPAQLLIYPKEGHVISEWSTANAADVARRMVEFLQKHLGASATRQ